MKNNTLAANVDETTTNTDAAPQSDANLAIIQPGGSEAKNAFKPEVEITPMIEPEDLDKAKPAALNIATQYYDFQQGVAVRAVFLGITTARTVNQQTSEEVTLPAVVFIDQTRTMYVNSAVKLVAAFENVEAGTPVQITWTGTKKTGSGGQMRLFDVRILKPV